MSERLNRCPNCKSNCVLTKEIINPNTYDLNADANLECEDCKHTWRGKVTSPRVRKDIDNGFFR